MNRVRRRSSGVVTLTSPPDAAPSEWYRSPSVPLSGELRRGALLGEKFHQYGAFLDRCPRRYVDRFDDARG